MSENKTYEISKRLTDNISKVILGKEETVRKFICAFLSGGHILFEDVPGTGKTTLIKSLALSVGGTYKRVQFTPDLLPSDITGINYYRPDSANFVLRKGPVFSNFVLADEINRATPRTQSALLECMEERQVTIDGESYQLPDVFMVMATMNPLDFQGTYALPEAQIDRFMMKLKIGYPDEENERKIVDNLSLNAHVELDSVVTLDEIEEARREISNVIVSSPVRDYIVKIARATRSNEKIKLGVSTRGVIALTQASKAWAAMNGRNYVMPDDIKQITLNVLTHRIALTSQNSVRLSDSSEALLEYIISKVPVPMA